MSGDRWVLLHLTSEWETFVGVVDLKKKQREELLERMDLAKALEKKSLAWMQWYDNVDVYEDSEAVEKWIDDHADLEAFSGNLVVVDAEPDCSTWSVARVDCGYANVDGSYCFWQVRLKHADHTLESGCLYRGDIESCS